METLIFVDLWKTMRQQSYCGKVKIMKHSQPLMTKQSATLCYCMFIRF